MNQYSCPVDGCGASFGEIGSVKAHITRKSDSSHKGLSGPEYWDNHGSGSGGSKETPDENQGQESPDSSELEFPENPDAEDSESAGCSHDSLQAVSPGHKFTTDDGREGFTESGDKWCPDCGAIVAADGEIYE